MIIGVFGADDNGAVQEIFGEEIWVPNEKTPGFADRSESNKRFWGGQQWQYLHQQLFRNIG